MKIKKPSNLIIIISLALGLFGLVSHAQKVNADSLTAGPLTITYDGSGPLFSENNISPSQSFVKTLTVKNNGTVSHSFALATKNVVGDLANRLYLKPTVSGADVWSETVEDLANLPKQSKTVVSPIAPGQTISVDLKAEFEQSANNDYQNKNVSFDLVFGTEEAEPALAPSATTTVSGFLLGLPARFGPAAVVSPSPSPTEVPTAAPTATGEVKGAQTAGGGEKGINWLLLLIPPAVSILSLPFFGAGVLRNLGLPVVGVTGAYVLSYFAPGNINRNTFLIILAAELVIIVIANILLFRKAEEILEEAEEELNKKPKRK